MSARTEGFVLLALGAVLACLALFVLGEVGERIIVGFFGLCAIVYGCAVVAFDHWERHEWADTVRQHQATRPTSGSRAHPARKRKVRS